MSIAKVLFEKAHITIFQKMNEPQKWSKLQFFLKLKSRKYILKTNPIKNFIFYRKMSSNVYFKKALKLKSIKNWLYKKWIIQFFENFLKMLLIKLFFLSWFDRNKNFLQNKLFNCNFYHEILANLAFLCAIDSILFSLKSACAPFRNLLFKCRFYKRNISLQYRILIFTF